MPESDVFAGAPHPRFTQRLVGHEAAERDALDAFRAGRMPHAWLIGGMEGIGKASFAWRLTRFLLANPDPAAPAVQRAANLDAPQGHPAMRLVDGLAHPDLALIRRRYDEKKKGLLTQIDAEGLRGALTMFHRQPAFGGWRICIVDCAEDLNAQSANALLKVIEEPPARSLILIVAHRIGAVLPTIRSRCRKVTLAPLAPAAIGEVVVGLGPPFAESGAASIEAAAQGAKGSVREALRRLLDDGKGAGAAIDAVIGALPAPPARLADALADALAVKGADEAWEAFEVALSGWIVERAHGAGSTNAREAWLALWDRLKGILGETEAMNLDKRLATHAMLAEIAGM